MYKKVEHRRLAITRLLFCLLSIGFILGGCASSEVSREAASNMDQGVQHTKDIANDLTNRDITDAYQNASQTTKGAIIGGTAGAVTGALVSGVGIVPGTATGIILGASYGSYIDSKTSFLDRLENRGVTLVVLGDQILIVIPSERIFYPMSARIKPQAYSTLQMVANYINQYTKMLVKISAYTEDTGSQRLDVALSKEQADCVAKALLASGIDARVLYAEGYGGSKLVQKSTQDWASDNYRIEITLEKLYV